MQLRLKHGGVLGSVHTSFRCSSLARFPFDEFDGSYFSIVVADPEFLDSRQLVLKKLNTYIDISNYY